MNILLSSVEQKTYMIQYFKYALNGSGKVFASNSVMTYSLTQTDGFLITPQTYDNSYVNALTGFCQANEIKYIIPLSDMDLLILAKNKEKLQDNDIFVVVSGESAIEICNDKWQTYLFLSSLGLPQPKTYINLESARQEIKSGRLNFPLFIKPRWGTEYMGVVQVDTMNELNVFYQRILHDMFQSYLRDISQKNKSESIIIQEKVEGDEYSLDILHDLKGNYITAIAKQKLAMRGSETDIAQVTDNKPFENTLKIISSNLQSVAAIDADCFITKSGDVVVLEINGRIGNQYSFAHLAGVNFPKQIIEWLKGAPTSADYISAELGIKGCKEWPLPVCFNFSQIEK